MRTPTRITVAVAGCSTVALALAGCGTVHAGQAASTKSATTARTATAPPTPAQRAAADADSLLAAFPPPPGAVKTGRISSSLLSGAPETVAGPDLATRTSWWRAPGQPTTVLSWIRTHMPSGITYHGSGYLTRGHLPVAPAALQPVESPPRPNPAAIVMQWDEFSEPAVPGVLSQRSLLVAVALDGPGQVAIRVDSEVSWLPAKPAGERIPASAKVVIATPLPGPGPVSAYTTPVTITDPAKVTEIADAVDGLPVFPPGVMSCPAHLGGGLRLTFRAALTGPTLAVVTADSSGCGAVQVSINGKPMRTLGHGSTLVKEITAVTGQRWPSLTQPSGPAR